MMDVLRSAAMAFSCFSKIPMPQFEWRDENMRYMMCFFPLVGLAVGLVVAAWTWLAGVAGIGPVLYGAGLALLPVVVTGGIHLDGFCDVIDAQSSHAEPARKREIMADPHIGAFAAIGAAAYLLAYAAFGSELAPGFATGALLVCLHVASRCMSGFATLVFPTSSSKGMLSKFHESSAGKRAVAAIVVQFVVCVSCMALVSPWAAVALLAAGLACLVFLRLFAQSQYGGMSGDLAGFFLQVAELAMLVMLVVVSKAVGL